MIVIFILLIGRTEAEKSENLLKFYIMICGRAKIKPRQSVSGIFALNLLSVALWYLGIRLSLGKFLRNQITEKRAECC